MIFTHTKRIVFALFFACIIVACDDDNDDPVLPDLDAYDGSNFEQNSLAEAALLDQLSALSSEMKTGRTEGVDVSASTLEQLYTAGSPSLSGVTSTYYDNLVKGTNGFLATLAANSGNSYDPAGSRAQGGVYGGYLFSKGGLEHEQMVEKGLFAAAMYNRAIEVMQEEIDATTPDRLLRLFGSNPDFPNSDNSSTVDNPDVFSAKYAARRDPNDGTGVYTRMRGAFIKLQAAIKGGDDFTKERDEALVEIQELWEEANAGTVINYLQSAISKLSGTNPSDATKASALHSYSEAVAFLHGWRTLDTDYRMISDTQIDELLSLLNAPANGAEATSYLFVTDPVNELPKLTQVIDQLQQVYGFSDSEIAAFAKNWVSEQGR